jgi:hypothetical protein
MRRLSLRRREVPDGSGISDSAGACVPAAQQISCSFIPGFAVHFGSSQSPALPVAYRPPATTPSLSSSYPCAETAIRSRTGRGGVP